MEAFPKGDSMRLRRKDPVQKGDSAQRRLQKGGLGDYTEKNRELGALKGCRRQARLRVLLGNKMAPSDVMPDGAFAVRVCERD